MANSVKGITIEFRGETTKLDSALKQIGRETKSLNNELKNVDRALKFNPTNVDLWRQKQQILTEKIAGTEEKLKLLKQQQAQMDADGVEKNSQEYRILQREIIESESQLKTFNSELKKIGNVNLRAASEQMKKLGTSLENAGQAMKGVSLAAAGVVASLGAVAAKSGAWADDINTMSKVYNISTTDLQKYAASAALVDVEVDTIAKSHVKLTKAIDGAKEGTGANAEAFEKLGVNIRDSNGSLRESDAIWQDVIKALGSVEDEVERDALAMQLMGKSAMELNPLIADGGETYEQMARTMEKYNLEFIDEETLAQANEFNDALDTMKAVGLVALQQVGTQLAAYLAPALAKVVEWVGKLAGWLAQLDPRVLTMIGILAGIIAVIAPLLIGLGKLSFAISSIMSLVSTIGPALAGVMSTIGPIILIIGALVAAGVLLYQNWDTVKQYAIELWNSIKATFDSIRNTITTVWNNVKTTAISVWNSIKNTAVSVWNAIKNAIMTPINAARNAVVSVVNAVKTTITNAWNTIKTTTSNIWNGIKTAITTPINKAIELVRSAIQKIKSILSGNLSFPKIKLPHFSIKGKFSLSPPSVPKLSIDWYKTGGIFSAPSVIGVGEAGPEAVVPLDKLWNKLDQMGANAGAPVINVYASPGMDVNQLAAKIEQILVKQSKQRNKAYGNI